MRWRRQTDLFGDDMHVLFSDVDQELAEVRDPRADMAFPMFRYHCRLCSDNLSSARPLAQMKALAVKHQREAHA